MLHSLLEQFTFIHLVIQLNTFIETDGSSSYLQNPAIDPHQKPHKSQLTYLISVLTSHKYPT